MLGKDRDQDEEFIRHLRGEPVDSPNPMIRDGANVVAELLDHPALCQVPPMTDEKLAQFKARLQQVKVPLKSEQRTWFSKWNHGVRVALPLAACFVVGLLVFRPDSSDTLNEYDKWRDLGESSIVSVKEPKTTAQDLVRQLSSLGIAPRLEMNGNVVMIEAYVPENKQQEVDHLLAPYQHRVGKNGELTIGFKQP